MSDNPLKAASACFLVKDDTVLNWPESSFFRYLEAEGFCCGLETSRCSPTVDWVFVNIHSKTYAPGRAGISYAPVVADHAITAAEFRVVWGIFKKYSGMHTLAMTDAQQREQDETRAKIKAAQLETECYFKTATYETYLRDVFRSLCGRLSEQDADEAMAAAAEQLPHYFKEHKDPASAASCAYYWWFC
ncbi:MAG: hypothetical protein IJC61_05865 [Oscillospiraceae bacterium]|nr:hypothetical protein [Oscillospiraceae bacterium]